MFSLLIQNGDGTAQRHALAPGATTIGRNPENKIVLADGSVSSRHAEIIVEDGKAILRDLNSSNGTTVNGAAVTEIPLTVGDEIVFGSVVCRAEASPISEVPAPLPVIAPAPTRDEVSPPPVKKPPVQINTAQDPTSPAQKEESAPKFSFWSKLLAFGKAASQEAKRGVQIAGTKAKIEKLRRMDLSNAHHELGKKCYELRLEEKLQSERAAIAELEKRIKEKEQGDSADENETTGGKIKRMAGNAKQSVEAKGLSMKMNQLLTALGKQIAESGIAPAEGRTELEGVRKVDEAIRHAEEELSKLSADKSQRTQMKTLTGSISSDAGAEARSGLRGFVSWIGAHPKPALAIVVILCASFVTYKVIKRNSSSHLSETLDLGLSTKEILALYPKPDFDEKRPDLTGSWGNDNLRVTLDGMNGKHTSILLAYSNKPVQTVISTVQSQFAGGQKWDEVSVNTNQDECFWGKRPLRRWIRKDQNLVCDLQDPGESKDYRYSLWIRTPAYTASNNFRVRGLWRKMVWNQVDPAKAFMEGPLATSRSANPLGVTLKEIKRVYPKLMPDNDPRQDPQWTYYYFRFFDGAYGEDMVQIGTKGDVVHYIMRLAQSVQDRSAVSEMLSLYANGANWEFHEGPTRIGGDYWIRLDRGAAASSYAGKRGGRVVVYSQEYGAWLEQPQPCRTPDILVLISGKTGRFQRLEIRQIVRIGCRGALVVRPLSAAAHRQKNE